MKIAIVEDEKYWREYAKKVVQQFYGENNQFELDIYVNGISYLKSGQKYDISFIDIEMPSIDGFETIVKAKQFNYKGIFIVLTTHLELSRKGYHVDAFRYIDKANIYEEVYEALKSAEIVLGRNAKVCVNVIGEGKRELTLKNIIYIETEKHYVAIHTKYGDIRCSNSMHEMEKFLCNKWFYRSHNAYIVNLDEVKAIEGSKAIMSNLHKLDIAKRKFFSFRRAYIDRQYECANG